MLVLLKSLLLKDFPYELRLNRLQNIRRVTL